MTLHYPKINPKQVRLTSYALHYLDFCLYPYKIPY
jgi:hypothetical protein